MRESGSHRPNGAEERVLIERALAGDAGAERELYDRHVDRVYRLAWRLSDGDPELARDFTQEAFVRAFDRLPAFRGDAAFATWIHSITVSVSLNGMRRVKRRRDRETGLAEADAISHPDGIEPDLRERLRAAVARLPEKYRVVFLMFDVEGYTHDEIAATLNMPTGTSKARLSRARAKLRTALAEFAGDWVS
jgi:RNA polymerase sigma-70 factor (ECF subfamily)